MSAKIISVLVFIFIFQFCLLADFNFANLNLAFNKQGAINVKINGNELKNLGLLEVIEGQSKQKYSFNFIKLKSKGQGLDVLYQDKTGVLEVKLSLKPYKKLVRLDFTFVNKSNKQLWPEIRMFFPVPQDVQRWYDGFEERRIGSTAMIRRDTLQHTFPVIAAYSKNVGLAYGFDPKQVISHFGNHYKDNRFGQVIRLVVQPKKETLLRQVIYPFLPEYGIDSCVDEYYKNFPEAAMPTPNIDSRILSGCEGGQENRPGKADFTEYNRLGGAGWIWDYAPFRATGDFYVSAEVHECYPMHDFGEKMFPGMYKCRDVNQFRKYVLKYTGKRDDVRQQFLARRKERIAFQNKASNIASMFYIISMCDVRLAEAKYKNAMLIDPDMTCLYGPSWVHVMAFDHAMSLWNNQFEKDVKRDLAKVTKELDISGFAFDCYSEARKTRLPEIQNAPGLGWDEKGVFLNQQIGTASMVDYLHSLTKDGKNMGMVGNGTGSYFLAFKSDMTFVEASPFKVCENFAFYIADRRLWGKRNGSSCYSIRMHDRFGQMIDYSKYSKEQLKAAYRSMLELSVLQCFNFGFYPNIDWIFGHEYPVYYVRVIRDILPLGPEIIPAIRCKDTQWVRRYGNGLNSYVFVGNPLPYEKDFSAILDNKNLSNSNNFVFLVTDYFGKETFNEVLGNGTKLQRKLQPREPWLIKPVIKLNKVQSLKANVSENSTFADSIIKAEIHNVTGKPLQGACRIKPDFKVVSLLINGSKVPYVVIGNEANFQLPATKNIKLEFVTTSKVFRFNKNSLKKLSCKNQNMSIELQEKTEMDKFSSIRIDNFFKMYRNEKGMKNFPKFKIFKGANEISLQNDTFLISGGTPLDRYNLTTKLLSVLDWEYPHFGKIGVWPAGYPRCGETRKMRKKAGLTQGSVLRWDNPKHFMNENFR